MMCSIFSLNCHGHYPERVSWGIEAAGVPFLSVVAEESAARARVVLVYSSCLLGFLSIRNQALYFFERKEPESVRPELGRCARPGFASFQVLTRTLRKHKY